MASQKIVNAAFLAVVFKDLEHWIYSKIATVTGSEFHMMASTAVLTRHCEDVDF